MLMIANAARPSWSGDVDIANHRGVGLPIPSKIRTEKISTIEAKDAERIGQLDAATLALVLERVTRTLPAHTGR